jgi:hypothetical protein
VLATPIAPNLVGISRHAGITKLSWAATNDDVVDTATNIISPVWLAVTNAPITAGTTNFLTNSWSGPIRFFRLRQTFAVSNLTQTSGGASLIGDDNNGYDYNIGQEFTLPSGRNYNLNGVALALYPTNGGGNVAVSVWSVGSDNNPSNQISMISTQLVTAAGNISFTPAAPIALAAGSYYLVAVPATLADSSKVWWNWTGSNVWGGFGMLDAFAGLFDGFWANDSISDGPLKMSVQATPVP